MSDLDVAEATNPELNGFFRKAELSPGDLSDDEYWKFKRFVQPRFGALEYAFLANHRGTIDGFYWEAIRPYVENLMSMPGYRAWWADCKSNGYHPDFIAYIDAIVREQKDGN